jgi:NADH-quinone oxidoreductase subunit L
MLHDALIETAVTAALTIPASLMLVLAGSTVLSLPLQERTIARLTRGAMLLDFAAVALALTVYLRNGSQPRTISLGTWFSADTSSGFAFDFTVDGAALCFALLSAAACGIVAAFSQPYLHREAGFRRYFFLFSMFATGMMLVALAGSMEVLFTGWEFLGLSSTLLVGFFHERPAPVRNALRVFAVYRVSDAAMLSSAVLLHHVAGTGSLSLIVSGSGASTAQLSSTQATVIALLLLVAVAGKSALLPFSGWLPRAMEGPTPSSAVYYGALSIHAGCFLLMRAGPLFERSMPARILLLLVGLLTALYATAVARVQTDVKSALAFAALTQVGLIVAETALGFRVLAFVHMVGHTCFRLLQFLTAPNVMHDLHTLENQLGTPIATVRRAREHRAQSAWRRGLYLFALERGFVDTLIDQLAVRPFRALTSALDRLDRALCSFGNAQHEHEPPAATGARDD